MSVSALAQSRKARSSARRRARRGLTLIEAALVISLVGVLIAAFVPTFLAHVRTSKVAEATERLASLHAHALAYYAAQHAAGRGCLPLSAAPYPTEPSAEPVPVDFASDAAGADTWRVLGATAPAAQGAPLSLRYSYEVEVPLPGCRERPVRAAAITLRARGDLDGDGEHSLLERSAAPSANGRELVPHGPLRVLARTE
jgi:type II secretory pathway pseudopilin PulG